jgi:hypothetical protein
MLIKSLNKKPILNHQDASLTQDNKLSFSHKSTPTTIPIRPSSHCLVRSISTITTGHIQSTYTNNFNHPEDPIQTTLNTTHPLVSHLSFYNLLTYDNLIDDSIFDSYFYLLKQSKKAIYTLNTNFHREFIRSGWNYAWNYAFNKYFLHPTVLIMHDELNINPPAMLIPF